MTLARLTLEPHMSREAILIASAAFSMASIAALPAYATDASGAKSDAQQTPEVIITGSMLPQTKDELQSSTINLSAEQIRATGLTTAADVIRSLPIDNSGSLPTAFVGGAVGGSGVALRGLTVNSTLVLVDGRRAAPYALSDDGQRSFVDLNTVPLESVERIEVFKDGASSLYGADAIAGVVNVILKRQFSGAEINVEVGRGQHPGGSTRRLTGSFGMGDLPTDRYNAYLIFELQGDDRILASDREFPFNTRDLSSIGGIDARNGTPGSFTGTTAAIVAPAVLSPNSPAPGVPNGVQVGAYRPLTSCTGIANSPATDPSAIAGETDSYCLQNKSSYTDVQPAQQRFGITGRLTVKLGRDTEAYLSESYYQNNVRADYRPQQLQNIAPVDTTSIALPPTLRNGQLNPNNPFAATGDYALIQYAFGDIPAYNHLENHNWRTVVGLTGRWGGWEADSALVVNHTWIDQTAAGLLNSVELVSAVDEGTYSFVNPLANTAAERAALSPALSLRATSDLDSVDLRVRRRIAGVPGGDLGLALGAELRHEAQSLPELNPNGDVQGVTALRISGSRNVGAAYIEIGLPLHRTLGVDLSGRYDHYSDFGNSLTPKVAVRFTPVSQLTVNGTWSRGFRAPSFAEIGSSQADSASPLTPSAGSPFPANFCSPTYHSAAYCLPYFATTRSYANPNLKPETSENFSLGLTLRPHENFQAAVNYYVITKENVIGQPNTSVAFQAYLSGAPIPAGYSVIPDSPDPAFPSSLPRPLIASGLYVNDSALRTDGLDIDLRGHIRLGASGDLSSELSITKIFSYKIELPGGGSEQFVGTQAPYLVSAGAGTPRYRASWSTSYAVGPLAATLTAYYTSGFKEVGVDATGDPAACLYTVALCHVASFVDLDFTGQYRFSKRLSALLVVQNIADRPPPLNAASYSGLNYNPTYHQSGIIGRFFRVGIGYRL